MTVEENEEKPVDVEEKEKADLFQYLEDFQKRLHLKLDLFNKNQLACKKRPDAAALCKLDSSLKKNSAFVKRLRNFTSSQLDTFLKDLAGLNLSKYLSEVATALTEVKLKITDVPAAVLLCCNIHWTYADFASIFLEHWIKTLHLKKNEPIENVSKLRVDLRFYGDLVSSGMLANKEALPLLGTILTILTNKDKENHHNVNIIISFCKHCGEDFAGLVPKHIRKLCEKYKVDLPRSTLLSVEKQMNVQSLFKEYYASLCQHLLKDHAKVQAYERQNDQFLRLKGEVRQERLHQLEVMQTELQTLLTSAETLAELLDQPLPPLPNIGSSSDRSPVDVEDGLALDEGIWEDDESRCFYQVFPNLQEFLPTVKSSPEQAIIEPPMSEDKLDEDVKEEDLEVEEVPKEEELPIPEEPEEAQGSNVKVVLESFLNNLPSCVNREMIDNAAVEFVVFHNTKNCRRKLIKALFGVSRTRLDLLPFYGRLVAILNPVIPEIAVNLTSLLKQDFKYHVRKKDQINLESKIKVSRYIGELVKFGLFPKIEALYCLKLLLHDFTHHHIEMACNILETCGRYLYRHTESHRRTKIYMDDMMRLKAATALDIRYTNMIENAYYFVNPPESSTVQKKVRPPLHEYIRKLVFQDLMCNDNERKVIKQMRALDWENEQVANYAIKCLSSAWKIKFHRLASLANLVAALVEFQEFVGTKVVDSVMEDIRLGMEINLPKMNQRRVTMIKYFGELYNYRLIESSDVFKVLYSLIMFGVSLNKSLPSPLDPPDNLIRIRLTCTLLDTCGKFLTHADVKTKLPYFFTYFQCYFWSKKSAPCWNDDNKFPVYAQYQLEDCREKNCPNVPLYTSYQEALTAVKNLQDQIISEFNIKQELIVNQGLYSPGYGNNDDDSILYEEDEEGLTEEEYNEKEKMIQNNNDDDFLLELDKMVSDNVQERLKESIRPSQDIVVPMLGKSHKTNDSNSSFVLLLRKGNKSQCKSLNVPLDSDLVRNLKHREEMERQEKEKVKRLTLDIQRMQLEDSQEQQQENAPPTTNVNHQRRVRYSGTQKVDRFLDLYCSNK
ncbi:regulator of nonsense transcripts 2 isoform X2 [Cimex lectularius]|uniref:MIF4G domain-containing protein n=1 Tax=Cimex lectularius TaxID=79782 RepID=A0A8I6RV19_CIMLE|nr:regulator of nonsense transcripts 2 isoform X2 [Cimex lectularius]